MMRPLGSAELNWALGLLSFALWGGAYTLYFARDLRGWFWRYRHRRELDAIRRAQGRRAYQRHTETPRHGTWSAPILPPVRSRGRRSEPPTIDATFEPAENDGPDS